MMNAKNWVGNKPSVYVTNGCSNHSNLERHSEDYYATDPKTVKELFEVENFSQTIWECACGEGHLSKEIKSMGKDVMSSDLVNRGYGDFFIDFLKDNVNGWQGDIITNPPYKYATQFVEKANDIINSNELEDTKVAMFLKLTFLEGKQRYDLFKKYPPARVYVYSGRRNCAKGGEFDKYPSSAVAYAWFVWYKGYKGDTIIRWIK